jgi:hypothetical protein
MPSLFALAIARINPAAVSASPGSLIELGLFEWAEHL